MTYLGGAPCELTLHDTASVRSIRILRNNNAVISGLKMYVLLAALVCFLPFVSCEVHSNDEVKYFEGLVHKLQSQVDFLVESQREDRETIHQLKEKLHVLNDQLPTKSTDPWQDFPRQIQNDEGKESLVPTTEPTISETPAEESEKSHKDLKNALEILEGERQALTILDKELTNLRKELADMVRNREKSLVAEQEIAELRMEIESLRVDLRRVKSEQAAQEAAREEQKSKIHEMTNMQKTVEWLSSNFNRLKSELAELDSAFNLTETLHEREEQRNAVTRVTSEMTSLRRHVDNLRADSKQYGATLDNLQVEIADIRSTQHNLALSFANLGEKVSTLKEDLNGHTSGATSTTTDAPGAEHQGEEINMVEYFRETHGPSHHRHRHHGGHVALEVQSMKLVLKKLYENHEQTEEKIEKLKTNCSDNVSTLQNLGDQVVVVVDKQRMTDTTSDDLQQNFTELKLQVQGLLPMKNSLVSLHNSSRALLKSIQRIEDETDDMAVEARKEISRLEFHGNQLAAALDILKQDQTDHYETLSAARKDLTLLQGKVESDHVRLITLQNQQLNQSLRACQDSNTDLMQELKIAALEEKLAETKKEIPSLKKDLHRVHMKMDDKLDHESIHEIRAATNTIPEILNKVLDVSGELEKFLDHLPRDCSELSRKTPSLRYEPGEYLIKPDGMKNAVKVHCDEEGWTVLQRRISGEENFFRTWNEYKEGFGDAQDEYWIGNNIMHSMTTNRNFTVMFELWDMDGRFFNAHYSDFKVDSEEDKYKLHIAGYKGNASDAMDHHNGMKFSTTDSDNDASSTHCAKYYEAGWWFSHCQYVNINGRFNIGMTWYDMDTHEWIQLSQVIMKVKPKRRQEVTDNDTTSTEDYFDLL